MMQGLATAKEAVRSVHELVKAVDDFDLVLTNVAEFSVEESDALDVIYKKRDVVRDLLKQLPKELLE